MTMIRATLEYGLTHMGFESARKSLEITVHNALGRPMREYYIETGGFSKWKDGEFGWCARTVKSQDLANFKQDPKTLATYLRVQAAAAFRDNEFEIAARLGQAATMLNEDARNSHPPNWDEAVKALSPKN